MKTSLLIEDGLFRAAKKEAQKRKKTLSEIISFWARVGRQMLSKQKTKFKALKAVDLGGPSSVDINSRRDWMDTLEP